jgi:diguanylate cyclase (GGDEF)-like protein
VQSRFPDRALALPVAPRPRVLVVDDDEPSLAALQALLEPLAAEIVCARSGERALVELEAGEFAVALLDVSMPGMDGFQMAARMRENPATRHLPLIFLTGRIDEQYVRRGYAVGAVDYLLKPFDPDILRSKVAVFVDLARLRLEAEVLTHRALHDPLTGLPNRALLFDRLERALARLQREPGTVAVLFLDLDEFKRINDTLGHHAGDEVLVEAAARLRAAVRSRDTAARYGGDEFVVVCEQLERADLPRLIGRINELFEQPISLTAGEAAIRTTIGAADTSDPGVSAVELIQAADDDMLEAKVHARRRRRAAAR